MTTRLQRRQGSGIYYCRAAVPKELIPIIGKREIKISLKTADPALARQRLVIESFKVDQQLAAARGDRSVVDYHIAFRLLLDGLREDDVVAVIFYGSEKAQEKGATHGLRYARMTTRKALSSLRHKLRI